MKLKEAFYCPECQEVFNYAEYQTVCPSCANRYAFSLQRAWFSQPKEEQNENVKSNRVYVTPVRYDVCRAGAGEDDSPGKSQIKSNIGEIANHRDKLGRDSSFCRFGIASVRAFTEFLNRFNVHRKRRKPEGSFQSWIQRFNADTLAHILFRR